MLLEPANSFELQTILFLLFLTCTTDTMMSDDLLLHVELISRRGLSFKDCSDEREGNLQPSTIFFVGSPLHVKMYVFAGYATIDKVWIVYRHRFISIAWAYVDLASRRHWMIPQLIWRIRQRIIAAWKVDWSLTPERQSCPDVGGANRHQAGTTPRSHVINISPPAAKGIESNAPLAQDPQTA